MNQAQMHSDIATMMDIQESLRFYQDRLVRLVHACADTVTGPTGQHVAAVRQAIRECVSTQRAAQRLSARREARFAKARRAASVRYPIGWGVPAMPTPENPARHASHLVTRNPTTGETGTACGELMSYGLVETTADDPCRRCLTSRAGQTYREHQS